MENENLEYLESRKEKVVAQAKLFQSLPSRTYAQDNFVWEAKFLYGDWDLPDKGKPIGFLKVEAGR